MNIPFCWVGLSAWFCQLKWFLSLKMPRFQNWHTILCSAFVKDWEFVQGSHYPTATVEATRWYFNLSIFCSSPVPSILFVNTSIFAYHWKHQCCICQHKLFCISSTSSIFLSIFLISSKSTILTPERLKWRLLGEGGASRTLGQHWVCVQAVPTSQVTLPIFFLSEAYPFWRIWLRSDTLCIEF